MGLRRRIDGFLTRIVRVHDACIRVCVTRARPELGHVLVQAFDRALHNASASAGPRGHLERLRSGTRHLGQGTRKVSGTKRGINTVVHTHRGPPRIGLARLLRVTRWPSHIRPTRSTTQPDTSVVFAAGGVAYGSQVLSACPLRLAGPAAVPCYFFAGPRWSRRGAWSSASYVARLGPCVACRSRAPASASRMTRRMLPPASLVRSS